MNRYNQYSCGSEWYRWDLHIHTPASALAHSFGDDWNIYVEKLINANQTHKISAIVTHFPHIKIPLFLTFQRLPSDQNSYSGISSI